MRTVELEEVIVARLRGQLLGVDHGLLESFALSRGHCRVDGLEFPLMEGLSAAGRSRGRVLSGTGGDREVRHTDYLVVWVFVGLVSSSSLRENVFVCWVKESQCC